MKNIKNIYYSMVLLLLVFLSSCVDDLLNRQPTTEISSEVFWNNTDDALSATYGVYNATRTLFGRDYYFDGQSEIQFTRGTSLGSGSWGVGTPGSSGSFGYMWNNAYRVINRANFVIENIDRMLEGNYTESIKVDLTGLKGECRFLRALAYFRLIQLWGDVPYYEHVLAGNDEAVTLSRTPIAQIKESIVADLTFAIENVTNSSSAYRGRVTQAAAYAFRGKVELYWASWNKYGWDELDGFTKSETAATEAYRNAVADFKKVINDYGLTLFKDGDPGTYDTPSYWELFQYNNEYASEIIFSVQYGGPNLNQGEEMLRDFGTRSTGNAQCWVMAAEPLMNRYQSTITGDYLDKIVMSTDQTLPNGSLNRATYENRDWRMKATVLWDGEQITGIANSGLEMTSVFTMRLGTTSAPYINYDANPCTGYLFRKWVRQEPVAERSDGPQDFYLMRLADVYLMYCEASNEIGGPTDELVTLVNKIRSRGNLPGLTPAMYADKDAFFKAIEQERCVELIAEGHRPFDIRRWRKVVEIWGAPETEGRTLYNTHGTRVRDEFRNSSQRDYQRYYIYQIPTGERDRNPNLTQNSPWL